MRVLILKFSLVLLLGHLLNWWVVKSPSLNLPECITFINVQIRIAGLILILILFPVLILFQKQVLKQNPETSIFQLTMQSAVVCLIAEFVFQILRQTTLPADQFTDRIYTIISVTARTTIVQAIFSFLIAFQIKTRNTGRLILMIIVFCVLAKYLMPLFGYKVD